MENKNELLRRLFLANSSFLSTREKIRLFDSKLDISKMTLSEIELAVGRTFPRATFKPNQILREAENALKIIENFDIKWISIGEPDFPAMLGQEMMKDPPFMIFYRGNLDVLKKKCVSVVGTRRCGVNGRRAAEKFAKDACDDGLCVVSGLAYGIDGAAHKGAVLSKNPATCAVLPSGIDIITPSAHKKLAAKILETNGLILSEYLPGIPALAYRFVQRNRIIAALSAQTVVIQSPTGGGAMITADFALDYNREVFFHNENFSAEGIALNEISELELKKQLAQGKKVEYKLSNSPKSYVEDGAPVVSSYSDFKSKIA